LLEGLDGENKMSKSLNNYVSIQEPAKEQFGKIMSASDVLMMRYYELLTDCDLEAIKAIHPMEAKKQLASLIVARFHGEEAGNAERFAFENQFAKKEIPENIPEKTMAAEDGGVWVVKALSEGGLTASNGEAMRMIKQGAVSIDGEKISDKDLQLSQGEYLLKVGKRKYLQLTVSA